MDHFFRTNNSKEKRKNSNETISNCSVFFIYYFGKLEENKKLDGIKQEIVHFFLPHFFLTFCFHKKKRMKIIKLKLNIIKLSTDSKIHTIDIFQSMSFLLFFLLFLLLKLFAKDLLVNDLFPTVHLCAFPTFILSHS